MNQPDDPGPKYDAERQHQMKIELVQLQQKNRYQTRWTVYHTLLVIGVWGIWLCTMYALKYGWGSW